MSCSFVLCFSLIQQAGIWSRHSIDHILTEDEDLCRRIHGFQSSLPTSFLFFFFFSPSFTLCFFVPMYWLCPLGQLEVSLLHFLFHHTLKIHLWKRKYVVAGVRTPLISICWYFLDTVKPLCYFRVCWSVGSPENLAVSAVQSGQGLRGAFQRLSWQQVLGSEMRTTLWTNCVNRNFTFSLKKEDYFLKNQKNLLLC